MNETIDQTKQEQLDNAWERFISGREPHISAWFERDNMAEDYLRWAFHNGYLYGERESRQRLIKAIGNVQSDIEALSARIEQRRPDRVVRRTAGNLWSGLRRLVAP